MCFLSVPHVGTASGSVDQSLLYARCIQVLPALGCCAAYVQLICWLYLHPHAKLHIIPETKKQLWNGLYCPVATFIIFNKIIHKLLWNRCSTERNLLLFSFSSFLLPCYKHYLLSSIFGLLLSYSFFLLLNAVTNIWYFLFLALLPKIFVFAFLIRTVCTAIILKPCILHLQILYKHVAKRSSRTPRTVDPPQDIFSFWFLTMNSMSNWIKTAVSFCYSNEALSSIFLLFFQAGAKSKGIYRSSGGTCRSGSLHGRDQQITESSKPHRWWDWPDFFMSLSFVQ